MTNYDYLSVATDNEVLSAYNLVMSSTTQEIKLKMAELASFPYYELGRAARIICHKNPEIFNLVNKQIENTRTKECLERQKSRKVEMTTMKYSVQDFPAINFLSNKKEAK